MRNVQRIYISVKWQSYIPSPGVSDSGVFALLLGCALLTYNTTCLCLPLSLLYGLSEFLPLYPPSSFGLSPLAPFSLILPSYPPSSSPSLSHSLSLSLSFCFARTEYLTDSPDILKRYLLCFCKVCLFWSHSFSHPVLLLTLYSLPPLPSL